MTDEQIELEIEKVRSEIRKDFGDFRDAMRKDFAELIKTIWITQLSSAGVILIGVGLLIHFHA